MRAVGVARRRCWEYNRVIDVDIKGFFDTIDHELMLRALDHHKPPKWIRLYVERWLKAPAKDSEGRRYERFEGTPQGGVISPLLANLFLHYVFDEWMRRNRPENPFERYADDIVVHCRTKAEAEGLLEAVTERLSECRLTVHPVKTKIVYCQDQNRREKHEGTEFDFLGFTFKPRFAKNHKGQYFVSFSPAISKKAEQSIRDTIRSWCIHKRTDTELDEIADFCNPRLRGWINYYGRYRRSTLAGIFAMFNAIVVKWAKNRFRKLRRSWSKAFAFFASVVKTRPALFAHWELGWYGTGGI
jgi:RNA-directed DNA polymerase